ncbi:uncharacterized protein LOC144339264 [Macaca mulatta]
MTGPEQRISRASLAAAAPAPGEAAGGGSWGEREPKAPADSERRQAGPKDARKAARGTAVSVDQSEDARRAAVAGATCRPGPGDAAGAGCPESPGVGLRGSRAELELGQRGRGRRGRQLPPRKAQRRADLQDWRRAGSPGPARCAAETIK